MLMTRTIVLIFLFLLQSTALLPENTPQRLHVPLKTEKSLFTLHYPPIQNPLGLFDASFHAESEKVIQKAISISGWYQSRPWKSLENEGKTDIEFTALPEQISANWKVQWTDACKRRFIHFYLCFSFVQQEEHIHLNARCLDARADSKRKELWKDFTSGPLTGKIDQDRMQILSLIDQINAFTVDAKPFLTSKMHFTLDRRSSKSSSFSHHHSAPSDIQTTEIWESLIDGSAARCLWKEDALVVSPQYVPKELEQWKNQGSLFYVSYLTGQPKIYWTELSDNGRLAPRPVTKQEGNQLAPSFYPAHKQLLFINDATGNPEIWIQALSLEEGRAQQPQLFFEEKEATQATAIWHPSGKQVVFVSSMGGKPRLYSLDYPRKKEQKPKLLTRGRGEATCPSISPDGKKLVYCVREAGKGSARQLWLYDFDTQKESPLTTGPGNKENPSWVCDSHHIVFNMDFGQKSALYMIDPIRGTPILLTNFSTDVRFPQCDH